MHARAVNRLILSAVLASAFGVTAAPAEDFYAGKTISIIESGGGAYEAYARTFARYMPKYIPGHPVMIVQSMPGAGGTRAANCLARVAPRDGTMIGAVHGAVLTAPLLNPAAADFDVTKFSWIGNATRDTYIGYVWHTAPVQSLEQAKSKQLIVGGTSLGGNGHDTAIILKEIFGYHLKLVSGYKSSTDIKLAMERREIDGTVGNAYSSLMQTDWLARGLVRIILQHGLKKNPKLPDVPLTRDLGRDQAERQMIDLLNVRDDITRPYVAPPGVPADRLALLRRAFDAALRDPAFLADMARQQLQIEEPSTGEELAKVADEVARTPPSVAQRLVTLFNSYKDTR